MAAVVRLLTFVDLSDDDDPGPDASRMSVSARLDAVLTDGRRVVLLADRGWNGQAHYYRKPGDEPSPEKQEQLRRPSIWAGETVKGMQETARAVVGPDEPWGDQTHDDAEAQYWGWLAGMLQANGVEVDGATLSSLPHDVDLSDRVLARIGGHGTDA